MAAKKMAPTSESLEKGAKKGMEPIYKGAAKKAMPEGGEDTEGADDEEDNAFQASTKKSMVDDGLTEEELQKSLDRLSAVASEGSTESRKEVLLKKSLEGDDLSKSEKSELFRLLGGETEEPEAPSLAKSVESTFTENETLQKAVDVSDYLDENQKALIKSLVTLSDRIESDGTRQHEFNLVLAKAMSGVGKLVKGMSERLGVIEGQPVRAPKSRGVAPGQVLQKGFAGQAPAGDSLNHAQVLDGLEGLMQKSMAAGRGGFSESNESIETATARFESSRQISPGLLAEVQKYIQGGTQH